ncbi:MAG: DUF4835 family protein [Bacteroidales bacterium]|nr:DUF4835 family protein [Bacteroidales bacterium]
MQENPNVVVQRPVYGTSYNTPLLNWEDKDVHFYFVESQPIAEIQ